MAKPGAGKRKMQAVRDKQWKATTKSLKSTGRSMKKAWKKGKKGCYIATCVYGSYDCPEVWVLRRFRDHTLEKTEAGRFFIKMYYAVSPVLVKLFGKNQLVKQCWKFPLDKMVSKLKKSGVSSTPYTD